jgi:photosystem II stability/assembly factor-like uncharacterized protein
MTTLFQRFRYLLGIVVTINIAFFASNVTGQWTMTAANLLGPQDFERGCITHQDGIVWAGTTEVYMSEDLGLTWTKRSPAIASNDYVRHINFYDENIGIVLTHRGVVYYTSDRGVTWKDFYRCSRGTAGIFLSSPDVIIIGTGAVGEIHSTRDRGLTWTITNVGTFIPDIRPLLGSSAIALAGYKPPTTPSELRIIKTTDYGQTWTPMSGGVDFDTYTFEVDPCEPASIYVINEDGTTTRDGIAQIFISRDGGNTWLSTAEQSITTSGLYYTGCISLTQHALFVQTVNNGILRSTDKGISWTNIGGPSAFFDTRYIHAVNANLIFAVDRQGSIWRTTNSGGDPLTITSPYQSLRINPARLFTADSLFNCDTPVVMMARLTGGLCKNAKVLREYIRGADSLDYKIVQTIGDSLRGNDSVLISFLPRKSGERNGQYVIVLDDQTEIMISLAGFGKSMKFIEPLTLGAVTDTIGGWVQVPITFGGLDRLLSLELTLHYETDLIYLGSYTNDGQRVDIPGQQSDGRSRLHFDMSQIRTDSASGFAYFAIYPRDGACPEVRFDSMSIVSTIAPCEYSIGEETSARLCPPVGCGISTITKFILHQEMPDLKLSSNPVKDQLLFTSELTLPSAYVDVIDLNGKSIYSAIIDIERNKYVMVPLEHIASGLYILSVRNTDHILSQLFFKQR